jgi:hypothetical protein
MLKPKMLNLGNLIVLKIHANLMCVIFARNEMSFMQMYKNVCMVFNVNVEDVCKIYFSCQILRNMFIFYCMPKMISDRSVVKNLVESQ